MFQRSEKREGHLFHGRQPRGRMLGARYWGALASGSAMESVPNSFLGAEGGERELCLSLEADV